MGWLSEALRPYFEVNCLAKMKERFTMVLIYAMRKTPERFGTIR